ncbi:hypothetical protein FOZ61_010947 [Perkinsus olseni]|uniref:Uncharacterized protein n=1 Tax=Perkinsus olseni TaxID=32597 RepID=A0A7J6M1U4_PEROL|nr:hypothetical protein FOZ61_010947 [Perkinsus olseni]KAF4671803.1 hypothetical protein FOL46_009887 [Perkinsus olseni]
MSTSIPTCLAVIQAVLIVTTALEPGTYIYEAVDCTIAFEVDENFNATLIVESHFKPGASGMDFSLPLSLPPVPLVSDDGNKTYSYDLQRADPHLPSSHLFDMIKLVFSAAGWVDMDDDTFPPAGTKTEDFTVITHVDPNAISIKFRGEPIILMKNGRNVVAGKYVYKSPTPPKFKLVYKIRHDGGVRIRAKCGKRGTPRFHFQLFDHFGPGDISKYYTVEPKVLKARSKQYVWDDVLEWVLRACPERSRYLQPDDLKRVVVANKTTIFVLFRESRLGLTRVSP